MKKLQDGDLVKYIKRRTNVVSGPQYGDKGFIFRSTGYFYLVRFDRDVSSRRGDTHLWACARNNVEFTRRNPPSKRNCSALKRKLA